ncbi:PREDICTED: acetylcholine receptor subunit beta-type acr-2-like [Acropora digitifera]|uniref:acetylcholine receptor subunit beta-type acr-2-like n=1 Tax=Acropora digitifera TaxID=70779 RepID=UPI00077A78F7|nr:PREDICTED: acetylcholine receptor subunit beta-type acr-2-like [Acropora digitifera]
MATFSIVENLACCERNFLLEQSRKSYAGYARKWVNPLLRWNVSENGGIQEINVDPTRIWKPDIYLYNNADEDHDGAQDKMQTKIKVDYNGTNRWLAPSILKSSCKINVRYFPFDEQIMKTDKQEVKNLLCFPVLSLLSFFLPSEAGERITLVITNMLALTVFMLIVADILPATSEVVPLISVYFTSILIEVGLSLIATVLVLKCYFTNPSFSEIPFWIRLVVIQGLGQLLKIEVKRERRMARAKEEEKKVHKRTRSMGDALDPNFEYCHQNRTNRRNSEVTSSQAKRSSTTDDTNLNPHQNSSTRRNNESKNKFIQPVAATDTLDVNLNVHSDQNTSHHSTGNGKPKSKRPVSIAESVDPTFGLYHQSHSSRRNTEYTINDAGVPPCGACHELTVDMLHLGSGFPLKNATRCPSRLSLRRESCYETLGDEKADMNLTIPSQTPLINAMLHRQEHLVDYVKELLRAVEEQSEHDSKREEWILVAEILDKFFLYLFVTIMIGSTVLIFSAGTSW